MTLLFTAISFGLHGSAGFDDSGTFQRGDQAARAGLPRGGAVGRDLAVDRKPVGHDDELVLAVPLAVCAVAVLVLRHARPALPS